jgi:hypothetical protein
MTDLSPATQAMLDDYWEAFNAPLEGAVPRIASSPERTLGLPLQGQGIPCRRRRPASTGSVYSSGHPHLVVS